MRAAIAGDDIAYEKLLREIAPAIRGTVRRRMAVMGVSINDSEDVVQETLLAIHLKRHTWRPSDPLGPWLWTIARNKLIDHLRKRGRRVELPIDDFADFLPAVEERPGSDAGDVDKHLSALPEKQRAVLRAVAVEGASVAETATRLKMTPGAIRVTLHRGFASLAARLKADE